MKTFLLIITLLFFAHRISSTPRYLSKNKYIKYVEQNIINRQKNNLNKTKLEIEAEKDSMIFIATIIYILMILYYLILTFIFNQQFIYFLSIIQVVTVIINFIHELNDDPFSLKIEDYKFRRWNLLFNLVLDYIYYPLIIYMLLIL